MFLKELKEVFFKNRTAGDLYLIKWVERYRNDHPERQESLISMLRNFQENKESLTDFLVRFSPDYDSSEGEKVAFANVYLYWLMKMTDDSKNFQQKQWRSFIMNLNDKKLESVLAGITQIVIKDEKFTGKEKHIVDFFESAIVNLAKELGKEKIGKKKLKKEELIEALELWYLDTYVLVHDLGKCRPLSQLCDKMFEYYVCITRRDKSERAEKNNSIINAVCAQVLFNMNQKEEVIDYARRSLCLKNPVARKNAFIVLGNSCIDTGREYWQLAYDTYYSWLHGQMIGELSDIKIDFSIEEEWRSRREGKKEIAQMWNNYAYLCSIIGDNLAEGSRNQRIFREYSLEAIQNAIRLERKNPGYNCTYGTLLVENGNSQQALKYYDKYLEFAREDDKIIDIASALREWSITCRELIFEWFSESITKEQRRNFFAKEKVISYFYEYFIKMKSYEEVSELLLSYHTWSATEEIEELRALEYILNLHRFLENKQKILPNVINRIGYLLLLIDTAVQKIENQLQKRDYGVLKIDLRDQQRKIYSDSSETIAYYTTLDTVKYLFTKLYQPDQNKAPDEECDEFDTTEGKNCLTMMHAMYMNDPNEGLTLLQSFENYIKDGEERNNLFDGMSAVEFREGMYDKNYIFLKAFTPRIDQLDMWAMYASDREKGSDSNGCCVCLNSETFRRAIDIKSKPKDKNTGILASKETDDFHLYRIVYVGIDGNIKKEKNPHLPEKVIDYYESLKQLINMLNKALINLFGAEIPECEKENVRNYVRGFLQYSFRVVAFLFKEESYFLEEEIRLIVTKSHDQKELIRKLHTNPPKLCINPFFQVYVDKLILGPKVKNTDEWIPYFQYELNNMRKEGFPEQVVVRKSKIHYRD